MKIFSPYHLEINNAIRENLPDAEFTNTEVNADLSLPQLPLPIRIGELLDFIDSNTKKFLKIGDLNLDLARKNISDGTKNIYITEKEVAILRYLANSPNIVSRDEMITKIWGYADSADSKTVENHIYRLRNKITEAFGREIIITEGNGYKLSDKS